MEVDSVRHKQAEHRQWVPSDPACLFPGGVCLLRPVLQKGRDAVVEVEVD